MTKVGQAHSPEPALAVDTLEPKQRLRDVLVRSAMPLISTAQREWSIIGLSALAMGG